MREVGVELYVLQVFWSFSWLSFGQACLLTVFSLFVEQSFRALMGLLRFLMWSLQKPFSVLLLLAFSPCCVERLLYSQNGIRFWPETPGPPNTFCALLLLLHLPKWVRVE